MTADQNKPQEGQEPQIKRLNEQVRPVTGGKAQLNPPTESEGENANGVCGLPCST